MNQRSVSQRPVGQERIADLLEPFLRSPSKQLTDVCDAGPALPAVLSSAQLVHISTYIDILLRWNARINLTAIRDPEEIVTRHFGESLFAARHLFQASPSVSPVSSVVKALDTVADVGSGAGFPGLPLKIWAPDIALTLIESNHKKTAFLREVIRTITLTDVNVQDARAETLAGTLFDVVTLRAVERFESILPIAADLVAPSGRLALLISSAQRDEACATLPHLTWSDPTSVPNSRSRVLLIGRKQ
jgi:16S rRNA (guanine527-N7)-methyltransferase